MKTKTLHALKKSIEHWKENETAEAIEKVNIWSSGCALCQLFVDATGSCDGCPVFSATGQSQCKGSPWYAARIEYSNWQSTGGPQAESAFRKAAKAEREFLESLLPSSKSDSAEDETTP